MPTTTATTGPPPTLADAVRGRIGELSDRNKKTFTVADFPGVAGRAGRPDSWLEDHLLVLEGIGILKRVRRPGARTWTVSPGSEYLR
ncbi:hypothetical protein [Streptomyces africanus]|uniref:hypothetical protein n=1 Tax=Streptomyces africanus TaxID=231024 RepID=UPI000A38BE25|nr:hypothetical protein [Streptomyces africanus]